MNLNSDEIPEHDLVCSTKKCRARPSWALVWNNPKVHTPDRRKTWLASDDHREHLASILGMRGFLREVTAVSDSLTPEQAPAPWE